MFLSTLFIILVSSVNALFDVPVAGSPDHLISNLDLTGDLTNGAIRFAGPEIHALNDPDVIDAPPNTHQHVKRYGSGQPYWVSQIKRQGKIAYGNSSYVLWRNVKDYGAKGDGITDDTDAINNATADGDRCGLGCDSQTVTPAIVYFPAGTYMVSSPLIQWYYTQFIGDANNLPVIKATPDFFGIGLFDSDVYLPYGYNWYTNQNNFWRQIRNFVLDITLIDPTRTSHCIHWQVAQATSLQNIVMNMVEAIPGDGNRQMGIFMDNGSGGWLEDIIINGGYIGFFSGNQQFTVRNFTFNRCATAIYQNWNWLFLYKSMTMNSCGVGIDMATGGDIPATGSIILQDSVMNNVGIGILTSFSKNSTPSAAGTLVLDHVNFVRTDPALSYKNGTVVLDGNRMIESYLQGSIYSAYESEQMVNGLTCWQPTADYARSMREADAPPKPQSLLTPSGTFVERSRPQYEGVPVASFISSFDFGCHGDGLTDDTQNVQNFLNSIKPNQIAYFDHGAYLIRNTIQVPNNIRIQGEIWPLFMVDGSSPVFQNEFAPVPAFRVGNPGDVGNVEMVDIVFETRGPAPGAIMMEWNLAGTAPGSTGMFDTHWRIAGSAGTLLQSDYCTKKPGFSHGANRTCWAAHTLLHITHSAKNLIMANNWGWVADHELDLPDHNQIDIYNGRGLLVESQGPVWIYGSSFEHSMLYNYNIANAKDIYLGVIQSETA
jgi:glucan 1,3-beta-glucosidase